MSVRIVLSAAAFLAALAVTPASAQQMSGSEKFCLKNATGALNCTFTTMAACEKDKQGNTNTCVQNPKATTGAAPKTN